MAHRPPEALSEATVGATGRVLLVDDQPELRRLFQRCLTKAGYIVVEAGNGRVAIQLAQQVLFDVVISDVRMPDLSGIELLRELYQQDPDLPVVLTSGSPDPRGALEGNDLGAFAYLVKPVPFEIMRETVSRAIDLRRARAAARELFEPRASVERLRVPRPDDER